MSSALRKPWTIPEFLAWEGKQELKYKFDGIRPVAMTGGTRSYDLIANNLHGMLRERLWGSRCRAFGPDVKVEAAGRIRYPDAGVECEAFDRRSMFARAPFLLAEASSDSSVRRDLVLKAGEYLTLTSVQHYLVLDQEQPLCAVFRRLGSEWAMHPAGAGEVIRLPEIGIELPVSEIYEGASFEDETGSSIS